MRTFQLFSALLFPVAAAVAQAGTLDPTFGTGGKAVANVPGTYCSGQALAQQADGKILVCGQTPGLTLLVRFNADGTLDTGFGTNGLVTTDVDASNDYIGSIAVQPDNKIVVAGNKFDALANGNLIVMRYSADGDLDNSFSSDGIAELVFPNSDSYATGLALQPDGKIVVCGERYAGSAWESFVTRFNPDGNWDGGFGTVQLDMGPNSSDNLKDIALQPDGRIVVCGVSLDAFDQRIAVARYNTDGTLDAGFGTGGKLLLAPGGFGDDRANSVRIKPDGKIIVAGISDNDSGYDVVAIQLNVDGSFDGTFGTTGVAVIPFGGSDWTQPSLALQPDGKIVIGVDNTDATTPRVKVIRLNADGSLDNSFGTAGIGTSNATPGNDDESAVRTLFLADGGIAVAGYAEASSPPIQLAVWKFLSGVNVGVADIRDHDQPFVPTPNPVDRFFTLTTDVNLPAGSAITIRDIHGRVVLLPYVRNIGSIVVDASSLPPGAYAVSIQHVRGERTVRFIKE